jgi:hypothetical protein
MLTDILYASPGLHLILGSFSFPLPRFALRRKPSHPPCFHVDAVLTCHQSVDTDVTHFSMLETIY